MGSIYSMFGITETPPALNQTLKFSTMAFNSLLQVLGHLQQQSTWQDRSQFRKVLEHWSTVVGAVVAAQTRPIDIQRDVLRVATSGSAWAQNLSFERQRILDKLNPLLNQPLTDIRFSTAYWKSSQLTDGSPDSETNKIWLNHPSRLSSKQRNRQLPSTPISDPQTAFKVWASEIQRRSLHLPLCPRCQCPTPPGELERWNICAHCASSPRSH